jgi:hypothetical protein
MKRFPFSGVAVAPTMDIWSAPPQAGKPVPPGIFSVTGKILGLQMDFARGSGYIDDKAGVDKREGEFSLPGGPAVSLDWRSTVI